jgi:hypothetical protein
VTRALAERTSRFLGRRQSRRSFLSQVAVVASAVVAAPVDYILRPNNALNAICGPAAECSNGYTVLCCTVNSGVNRCPPNMFVGGWWRADGSAYCCSSGGGSAPRYYIDCHPRCQCGCDGAFCPDSCHPCSCHCNDGATCDRRRVCCNYFRYGQCHTEIGCSGPVACRVVSCVPPYQLFDDCGSTLRFDNATANHTAPCMAGAC